MGLGLIWIEDFELRRLRGGCARELHVCIHRHEHTYMPTLSLYIQHTVRTHTHTHTHIHTYKRTHIRTYICVYIYTYKHTYLRTYNQYNTYIHTHMHTYLLVLVVSDSGPLKPGAQSNAIV